MNRDKKKGSTGQESSRTCLMVLLGSLPLVNVFFTTALGGTHGIYLGYNGVLPAWISVYLSAWLLRRLEEVTGSPITEVSRGCELPCGRELAIKPGSLQVS